MSVISEYQSYLEHSGKTSRDRVINRAKYDLLSKAPKSPDYKQVFVNGQERYVLMHRSDTFGEKFINCMPDETVKIGDYVIWENRHFLVTNTYMDDDVSLRATIVRCNRIFRWQNPETLQIYERWAAMYRPYTSSSFGDSKLQVSDREFKVYVPYDNDTITVRLDQRFMLEDISGEPKVYCINTIDANSRVYTDEDGGYIIWNIEQAQYNPEIDDNLIRVSNYQEPYEKQNTSQELIATIKHIGGEDLKINGSYKRFSYEFVNKETKEIAEDIEAHWLIDYEDMDYIQTEINDNNIRIKVLKGASVNSVLTLSLVYNDVQYAQLQLKVVNII